MLIRSRRKMYPSTQGRIKNIVALKTSKGGRWAPQSDFLFTCHRHKQERPSRTMAPASDPRSSCPITSPTHRCNIRSGDADLGMWGCRSTAVMWDPVDSCFEAIAILCRAPPPFPRSCHELKRGKREGSAPNNVLALRGRKGGYSGTHISKSYILSLNPLTDDHVERKKIIIKEVVTQNKASFCNLGEEASERDMHTGK